MNRSTLQIRPLSLTLLTCLVVACFVGMLSCDPFSEDGDPDWKKKVGPEPTALDLSFSLVEFGDGTGGADDIVSYQVSLLNLGTVPATTVFSGEFGAATFLGEAGIVFNGVPSGMPLQIIAVGFSEGGTPLFFGKSAELLALPDERTSSTLALYPFDETMKPTSTLPNVLFPTLTPLPDGRVLLAGGFTRATEGPKGFEIGGVSSGAALYDPTSATWVKVESSMNRGRGAHAAVYLPTINMVLLAGGTERINRSHDEQCFPWYFLKEGNLVGSTYELFDVAEGRFLTWDSEWPDSGHETVGGVTRVFPVFSVNSDGSVLLTGGGEWPSCETGLEMDSHYKMAEFYRPATDEVPGGFVDTFGAHTMHAIRSGHTAVTFIGEGGRATHLFWGGTADGPYAEYYHESAGQSDGIFSPFVPAEFLDSNSYKKRPLFHTMTPLGDGQFLLAGGVLIKSGKLTTPSAGDSFIIDLASNGKIGVATVDGLGLGRYFHQAISSGSQALVLGGFTTKVSGEHGLFGALAASDARLFDSRKKGGFVSFEDAASAARGGGAAVLSGSQMLVAGGIVDLYVDLEGHADSVPLRTEALTPSFLCPEELWSTGCIAQ